MWTTDTFSQYLVKSLCLKWTSFKKRVRVVWPVFTGLRLRGKLGGQDASERTSIQGMGPSGEWGGGGGGLREDFHQRAEAVRGGGGGSEKTSIKGLRGPGEGGSPQRRLPSKG